MLNRKMIAFIFMVGASASCKMHSLEGEADKKLVDLVPKRVDATSKLNETKLSLSLDENGNALSGILIGVDYLESPKANEISFPKCLRYFPSNFVIGEYSCYGNSERKLLTAGYARQNCFTAPEVPVKPADSRFSIPGCRLAQLSIYNFEPQIRVMLSNQL